MSKNELPLNLAVVPQEFLRKLEEEIVEIKEIMRTTAEADSNAKWIESKLVPKLLGISRKTWQTYRDQRLIAFSQIGAKIYVKKADIEKFMTDHYIQPNL